MTSTLITNSELMTDLKSALYIKYNKERKGIHVSDVVLCPRESCFRRLNPQTINDKEINFFTSGASIHVSIQTLAEILHDLDGESKYEIEKEVEFIPIQNKFTRGIVEEHLNSKAKYFKIQAHIDLYNKKKNIPIEAKSSRTARLGKYDRATKTYSEEKAKPHHIDQLKTYMALVDADKGYILYQFLMNFETFPFTVFEVTTTKEERIEILQNLVKDSLNLLTGIETKNPGIVKHIADDKDRNWKCNSCKYVSDCIGYRNGSKK